MPAWLNAPNALTALRLLIAPFAIRSVVQHEFRLALILFACAAATDGLDGWAARRFRAITPLGAYLDPVADKVLLSGAFLSLAAASLVPVWYVALVFGRDFLILLGAGLALALTSRRRFPPSKWGKLSTFLQILTAVSFLVWGAFPQLAIPGAPTALLWSSAAVTAWSGLDYALKFFSLRA